MRIEELKMRAIALEQELKVTATQSTDIAKLAEYKPLISAIRRAKAGEITEIEKIPGMYYWSFESDIFWKHKALGEVFARFTLLLEGVQV